MKKSKRFLLTLAVLYWILVIMVYIVAGDQFHYTAVKSDTLSATVALGELVDGQVITQRIIAPAEKITQLEVLVGTYGRKNTGTLHVRVLGEAGEEAAHQSADISELAEGQYNEIALEQTNEVNTGEVLTLELTTEGCFPGNAVSLYCGNSIEAGRFDIVQQITKEDLYTYNGMAGAGRLCVQLGGLKGLSFYKTYWLIVAGLFAAIASYAVYGYRAMLRGKTSVISTICALDGNYRFLLKQLVSRDFKSKYKRSVLGMAWSFLNPLLTMAVQYVVFSTLFKSSTPNYAVYLLTGIVLFNFFSEAVSLGMTSIVGNASLIKKVYMPKYIYPVSRLFSSLINFVLATIPLFIVMLVTGEAVCPSVFLLIFDVLCLMGFVLGMMLLMSTAMTFFQDMQFLWGVISLIWMYLTPIFYTENIIAPQYLTFYRMNPMYQYITFARTCIIDGISPAPLAYLWCLLSAVIMLLLGIFVFKKNQDKFVLYL